MRGLAMAAPTNAAVLEQASRQPDANVGIVIAMAEGRSRAHRSYSPQADWQGLDDVAVVGNLKRAAIWHPGSKIERSAHPVRNVVNHDDAVCPAIIGASNCSEPFLPSCIPLQSEWADK